MSARTRVLFVDDDQRALTRLQSLTAEKHNEWEMLFCAGAQEALDEMAARGAYDIVVSDLRMPNIDGAAFLSLVQERFPESIRIVASDFRDLPLALRSVPVAHQFLAAPLEIGVLNEAIARSRDLQHRLNSPALRGLLQNIETLPSPPLSVLELNQILARPDASLDDVARVIEADTAMTAKLLQLVNSAFFGLNRRVSNAQHAVSYLGLATVRNLLSAVELVRAFTPPSPELITSIEGMHTHSLAVAEMARSLMSHRHQVHDAFAAGMMHDIGLLAVLSCLPNEFIALREEVTSSGRSVVECELDVLGAPHAQLGAYLLTLWGLPYSLVEAVARSHDAESLPDRTLSPTHAVYVAEQVTNVLAANNTSWEGGVVPSHDYLAELGLDEFVTDIMTRSA